MSPESPLATVAVFSSLCASAAILGALPQALGRPPSRTVIGWANALAAGLMLGVAYTLLTEGLDGALAAGGLGTLFGLGFVRAAHAIAGTGELDLDAAERAPSGSKVLLVDALHSADEGVAIGVAMAVSPPLGMAMAITLGVHNVPESMVLNTILTHRGVRLSRSAALAVAVRITQVVMAVVAFALVDRWAALLPWLAGFAVGALFYRILVELLPESYQQAGRTSIAVVTLMAAGVVVLLAGAAA